MPLILSVNDKHQFKKGDLLYRFRYDDGTYRTKYASSELAARVSPCLKNNQYSTMCNNCRVYGCTVDFMDYLTLSSSELMSPLSLHLTSPLRDHRSLMGGTLRNVLNAQKLIEWLLDEHDIISREEGVALGRQFIALGVLRHGK